MQSENQGIQLLSSILTVLEGFAKARKSQLQRDFIYFLHAAETPKRAVGRMQKINKISLQPEKWTCWHAKNK